MNRRSFFKSLAGLAAFVACPKLAEPEPKPKTEYFYPYLALDRPLKGIHDGSVFQAVAFNGKWHIVQESPVPVHYNCRCKMIASIEMNQAMSNFIS